MPLAAHIAALIAVLSTGVIYGTDAFCALVQRPALARVDDATLTAVMGNVHRFGDRRLPVPGILGIIASAAACVFAALAGRPVASATAGAALALLVGWVLLYLRVSAPINRALTAAADKHETVHWPRHIPSLRAFGVTTHGIWTQLNADAHRLVALISYPDGADPAMVTSAYMASPGFAADIDGFDVGNIVSVEELLLDPAAASPLS
jgi:hypothetical protein